nr:BPK_HP1_G0043210.mRNA.1.CDS.1 [Saccharomyces cerevisiae]
MVEKGVRSSMFLPGFFTTLFQKKLPTEIQPRIGDMVFLEGIDSIMRILATLLSNSRDHLLKMGFDDMLELLKSGLLDAYIKQNDGTRGDTLLSNECMDKLLQDSMMKVAITPKTMKKYSSEYEEIHRLDNEKEVQYKSITEKNLHLQKALKNRLNIESVLNENNGYKLQILDLKKKLDSEKKKQVLGVYVPNDLKKDLEETMKKRIPK